MNLKRALLRLAAAAALLAASPGYAQFTGCTLQEQRAVTTGNDPIGYARLAVRADGRPLVVYTTAVLNASSMYLYDCADPGCSSGQNRFVDVSSNYRGAPGIVIRANGLPGISATRRGGVRFYDCETADCMQLPHRTIRPDSSAIYSMVPATLSPAGNPVLAYNDSFIGGRPLDLVLHRCTEPTCFTATDQTLVDAPAATSTLFDAADLAFGSDGRVTATYLRSLGQPDLATYEITRCGDIACANASSTTISMPTGGSFPDRTDVAVRSNQRPLALDGQSGRRVLLDCSNDACSATDARPLPANATGRPFGLQLLAGDRPAFALLANLSVAAYACADATCSAGVAVTAVSQAATFADGDFVVDTTGRPVLAYVDGASRDLFVATCSAGLMFESSFEPNQPLAVATSGSSNPREL